MLGRFSRMLLWIRRTHQEFARGHMSEFHFQIVGQSDRESRRVWSFLLVDRARPESPERSVAALSH